MLLWYRRQKCVIYLQYCALLKRVAAVKANDCKNSSFPLIYLRETLIESIHILKSLVCVCSVLFVQLSFADDVKSTCVVTATDSKYIPCVAQLVPQIRTKGKYYGSILILAHKDLLHSEDDRLAVRTITEEHDADLVTYDPWSTANGRVKSPANYLRLYIFTDPHFRTWCDIVLYLDADTIIQHPIYPLFDLLKQQHQQDSGLQHHYPIIMRDNGHGMGKKSLAEEEFSGPVPVADTMSPGTSCQMLIDLVALPNASAIDMSLQKLHDQYGQWFKFKDQTLLNVFFRDKYCVMWPCVDNIVLRGRDELVWKRQNFDTCGDQSPQLTLYHDWQKWCLAE